MMIIVVLHLWYGDILHYHSNDLILKLIVGFITHFSRSDSALWDHLGIMQVLLALCHHSPLIEESRIASQ